MGGAAPVTTHTTLRLTLCLGLVTLRIKTTAIESFIFLWRMNRHSFNDFPTPNAGALCDASTQQKSRDRATNVSNCLKSHLADSSGCMRLSKQELQDQLAVQEILEKRLTKASTQPYIPP
jgi:hypothetical protein